MKSKAKRRAVYRCTECGAQAAAQEGRCHNCGKFGTMQREAAGSESNALDKPLDAGAQAVIEVLVENLKGETRKQVTECVQFLLRPKADGGVGLSGDALLEAAQDLLDQHQRQPKDRPLAYLVAVAKAGRKPKRFATHEDVVDSWKPITTPMSSLKQILADLPALAAAGTGLRKAREDASVLSAPAAATDVCEVCGGDEVVRFFGQLVPCPRCTCSVCRGSRLVLVHRVCPSVLTACPECAQETPEGRRARFLRLSGIEGPMAEMTLPVVDLRGVEAAVAAVMALVEGTCSSLVLTGGPGRGKTHLAVAAMIECIDRGMSALYLNTARFLDELRGTYSPEAPMDFEDKMRPALTWDVVVLDDLAGERRTDWAQEKLFEIVDTRYARQLRTIACSNYPMRTWDPRVVSRLSDRRRGMVVTLEGDDYRLRQPK